MRYISRVSICSNGNIAIISFDEAYLYDGTSFHKLTSPDSDEAKLIKPKDVAVTTNNVLVITDTSRYVKLFQSDGQYVRSICTLKEDENPDTKVVTRCVAVSSHGHIVVGDWERALVTVHSEIDGSYCKGIKTLKFPLYIAITSKYNILVCNHYNKVAAYNMETGSEVFVIDTWKLDVLSGYSEMESPLGYVKPCGLSCDTEDNIYIAVITRARGNGQPIIMYMCTVNEVNICNV